MRLIICLTIIIIFLTYPIRSVVQKEISIDEEIDLFSTPSSTSVQTIPTRTTSITREAATQMQEMNRVIINQRMEINHLKAQLARCVSGREMAENVLDGNVPSVNAAVPPTLSVAILTLMYYAYTLRQRVRRNKQQEKDLVLSSRHIIYDLCNEFLSRTTLSKFRIEGEPSSKELAEWIQRRGRWENCPIKTRPPGSINMQTPRFRFQDAIHLSKILRDACQTTFVLNKDSKCFSRCLQDLEDRLDLLNVRLEYVRRVLILDDKNDEEDDGYPISSFLVSSSTRSDTTTYVSTHNNLSKYESTCLNFRCVRENNEWRILSSSSMTEKIILRSEEVNQEPWNIKTWRGEDSQDVEMERQISRKDIARSLICLLVTKYGRRSIPQDILNIMDNNRVRQEIQRRLSRQKTKEDIQSVLDEAFRAGLDETSSFEVCDTISFALHTISKSQC